MKRSVEMEYSIDNIFRIHSAAKKVGDSVKNTVKYREIQLGFMVRL